MWRTLLKVHVAQWESPDVNMPWAKSTTHAIGVEVVLSHRIVYRMIISRDNWLLSTDLSSISLYVSRVVCTYWMEFTLTTSIRDVTFPVDCLIQGENDVMWSGCPRVPTKNKQNKNEWGTLRRVYLGWVFLSVIRVFLQSHPSPK